MSNKSLKEYALKRGVKLWQIANALHITDSTFSRKLRVELSEEKKEEIKAIIDELATM